MPRTENFPLKINSKNLCIVLIAFNLVEVELHAVLCVVCVCLLVGERSKSILWEDNNLFNNSARTFMLLCFSYLSYMLYRPTQSRRMAVKIWTQLHSYMHNVLLYSRSRYVFESGPKNDRMTETEFAGGVVTSRAQKQSPDSWGLFIGKKQDDLYNIQYHLFVLNIIQSIFNCIICFTNVWIVEDSQIGDQPFTMWSVAFDFTLHIQF